MLKKERGLFRCKKGEDVLMPALVFFILNIIFFSLLLAFVIKTSSGALIYEQTYAKQIALAIDQARPEMEVLIDVSKGLKIAEKNKKRDIENIIEIDKQGNNVLVNLDNSGGYNFTYFSDYDINFKLEGNIAQIIVNEKQEVSQNA